MGLVRELIEIGVKTALAPVIVPLEVCRAVNKAIDDLNGPPEDNWDPESRTVGYEDQPGDSED